MAVWEEINYQDQKQHFPWVEFCDKLEFLIAKEQLQDWTLRFECGRYISKAPCGYYVMEVLDIKALEISVKTL
ncbi:hypothetical protein O9992_20005 [Vibrio lentus]|nr:hypothetical protein [Vibrio lentus]